MIDIRQIVLDNVTRDLWLDADRHTIVILQQFLTNYEQHNI